ncbi:EAL domain-containing protein [Altererythrobacter sp. KTW20L]|uniref:putative bifunctional diguanylate cyclase/phosphodiesterase n=1 Tax=Altererythrobacter sp. KTW20L TaxID=2942210 RepID=UPI0020C12B64|nr:EAL domain-containing protein [Altererythrobacter sp. KTW20L]MCL6251848.1 EAL domain-containing protein [Altererythrobacter sp. KTW20L]
MAMRDMLRKVTGESTGPIASDRSDVLTPLTDTDRLALLETLESSGLGWFWATDPSGRLTYLSPGAIAQIDRYGPVLGAPLTELVETIGEDGEVGGERPLGFVLAAHGKFRDLAVRLQGSGHDQWWSLTGHPHIDEQGEFQGFRGSARDISAQFSLRRDEERLAQYDTLTGAANRYRMANRLDAFLGAFRSANRSCALLLIDLDRFKQVNDSLGHQAGDEVLRQVAQRLERIGVNGAEVGRLGGDEFQIILPDIDDRGMLGDIALKIIQLVSQPYATCSGRALIGASVGIAVAPYDGMTRDELVKSADLALYAAKGGGRGQYRFYASDLASAAESQRMIGEELREALGSDELDMHYQPIVRASDNAVVAFEALMRWDHPGLGAVGPDTFIPIADDLGLSARLGEWALERACRDAANWPGEIRVSVNVSAQHFFSGTLADTVEDVLERTGLKSSRLELEVTEWVFMGDQPMVDATFARLRKTGVRLSLDDFGTGSSSLAFLRRGPFDKIKIDRSFVRGCSDRDNPNAAIITAIVSLASALNMETIAEGVEAMDELELVRDPGVAMIQGFIFSRAVPNDVVMARLASGDFTYEPVGPVRHRAERRTQFRRIGVIHENHRYDAMLRNLSRTGALIEGLLDVPVGTELVIDLGGGQLAVAVVRRSQDATQGVEFETPLVSDGAQGLCTRHRVSPHQLAAVGAQVIDAASGRRFMQVDVSARSSRAV